MIVPRSSLLVHEDAEYGLYSVTVFQKVVDEFKTKAREKKWATHSRGLEPCESSPGCRFIVRDFTYDQKAIAQEKQEKSKLELQLKKQFVSGHFVLRIEFSPTLTGSTDELAEGQL